MFTDRANEQGAMIAKIIQGKGSPALVAKVQANFAQWLRDHWNEDEGLALAHCVRVLAEACGGVRGEWGTLSGRQQSAVVWFFSLMCLPSPDSGENDAAAFYRQALASGGLANIARTADLLRGQA
ncbi:hypothetical protein ABZ766_37045 [Streptomyces sp. NPDC006670]|uniref:hypothetical protein n=1 Tax=Streptomyces sp. NPDC006670 TaxID=3154476 RepID=UPI003400A0F8